MRHEETEDASRWQPMMIILRGGGRLECKCGALAVIVVGKLDTGSESDVLIEGIECWCQACYTSAQEEETDD